MGADKCGQKRGVATAHRPRRIQKRVEKEKNALPNKIRSANKQSLCVASVWIKKSATGH